MTSRDRLKPRLPRGFADRTAADIRATERMVATIRRVYERYGFEPVETPLIEFTDALGKFLPDQDRPNEGVFSFRDEDSQEARSAPRVSPEASPRTGSSATGTGDWLSLRYDLTAPLARYVAENYERLPKPYRSYRAGWVFRNEKPGPGRFRQFMQFDADTVGSASPAADAEMCMMMADTMEALGIPRGQYVIKVNSRKVLDGVMEAIGLAGDENAGRRLTVLRAIDKLDRLGIDGVRDLLGPGRKDESGDFTRGAGLTAQANTSVLQFVSTTRLADNPGVFRLMFNAAGIPEQLWLEILQTADASIRNEVSTVKQRFATRSKARGIELSEKQVDTLVNFFRDPRHYEPAELGRGMFEIGETSFVPDYSFTLSKWREMVGNSRVGNDGVSELEALGTFVRSAGYSDRVDISSSVVRGLEYYTGAVFEAELLAEIPNEKGQPVVFGSVGGGGRYDGLVGRFMSENVPATGFSIGVSRLQAALSALGNLDTRDDAGPVVVTVMERERIGDYQRMVADLRKADIPAELYLGASGMKAQLKYADRRNAPLVIIQGSDEKAKDVVQIKDLAVGKKLAETVGDNAQWREERPGQVEVAETELVAAVKRMLGRGERQP